MSEQAKIGLFPAFVQLAEAAAKKIIEENLAECVIEGQDGFVVAPERDHLKVFGQFEFEGRKFIIFEKDAS